MLFRSWLAGRGWDRSFVRALALLTLGTVLPFITGVAWLTVLIGFDKAVALGLVPFLAGAVVKLALAAAVMPLAWKAAAKPAA